MKFIEEAQEGILSFFNYPYINKELLSQIKGPIILHISDTPLSSYNYIFRLINILKPKYIIHTGDMVDNVKLEIRRNRLDCYRQGIERLTEGLENNSPSKIFYVMGNHDHLKTVKRTTKKGIILSEGSLELDDFHLNVSHYFKEFPHKADFNLYGHSPVPGHHSENGINGLNGLLNINIIDLSNGNVFHIKYPIGTNSARGMEFKRIKL
ncbi:MAG: metallophosphoesterase [Tissierellaceae bacterium]